MTQALALGVYLALVLVLCLPWSLDNHFVRERLTNRVSQALSLPLEVNTLRFSLFPEPLLQARDLTFSISENVRISLDSLRILPDWKGLLLGKVRIDTLQFDHPLIIVEPLGVEQQHPPDKEAIRKGLEKIYRISKTSVVQGELRITKNKQPVFSLEISALEFSASDLLRVTARGRTNICEQFSVTLSGDPQALDAQGEVTISGLKLHALSALLPGPLQKLDQALLDFSSKVKITSGVVLESDFQGTIPAVSFRGHGQSPPLQIPHFQGSLHLSPGKGRINLEKMCLFKPELRLRGSLDWIDSPAWMDFALNATQFQVQPVQNLLSSVFENKTLRKIFNIVQKGRVPRLTIKGSGGSGRELMQSLQVQGEMEQGEIKIPELGMHLTRVSGSALVDNNVLRCKEARASLGRSRAGNGRLTLGLNHGSEPFVLKTEVEADLSQLPGMLKTTVSSQKFLSELELFKQVAGKGQGMLRISKKPKGLTIEADLRKGQLRASYEPLPFPLKMGPGRLTWSPSSIVLDKCSLELGNSGFEAVSSALSLDTEQNSLFFQAADSTLDLAQILPWLRSLTNEQGLLQTVKPSGSLDLETLTLQGALTQPEDWDIQGKGAVHDLQLRAKTLTRPIQVQSGAFVASNNKLEVSNWKTTYLDLFSTFSGRIEKDQHNIPFAELSFSNGQLGPRFLAAVEPYLPLPEGIGLKSPFRLQSGAFVLEDFSLTSLRALVQAGPTSLELDFQNGSGQNTRYHFQIVDKQSKAELGIQRLNPDLLDIQFTGHLLQESLDHFIQLSGSNLGSVLGHCHLRLARKPFTIHSALGRIQLSDIFLPLTGTQDKLGIEELTLKALPDKILVQQGRFLVQRSALDVSGEIDFSGENNVLRAKIRTGKLNWEELQPVLGKQSTPEGVQEEPGLWSWMRNLKARVDLTIDSLYHKELVWNPLQVIAEMDNGQVTLRISPRSRLCTVQTFGSLSRGEGELRFRLQPEAVRQDLGKALTCLPGLKNKISGLFSLKGELKAKANNLEQLKHSLQGTIHFSAHKGRIYKLSLLDKVLQLLNTKEIFFGRFPDLDQQGLAYNRLDIHCSVRDSVLIITQGHLNGQSMNIDFQGRFHPDSKRLELMLGLAPLKTLDKVLHKLPVIKHITGKSLVSIPFKISGTLEDYSVSPLPPEAVGRSFFNLMQKTLKLPVTIIQPLIPD